MIGQFTVNNASTNIAEDYTTHEELLVYPNPTVSTISLLNNDKKYAFKIYSITGQIELEGNFNTQLDLSFLPNGMFVLELIGEHRKRIMIKKL